MFNEILNIQPKLDEKDMRKMEMTLQARFTKIAKGFGRGLASAITGGGIIALGGALINKLLNPLKETQEIIDRLLKSSDDVATNAKQFGTTAGGLFRLQSAATATGLEKDSLYMLLTKFQVALAEARQDPTKQTSVRNFVGYKDTAEAFLQYIQGLQKMSPDDQVLAQKEVFGEKQILKMSDFLNANFNDLFRRLGGPSTKNLSNDINQNSFLNDEADLLLAKREISDLANKSRQFRTVNKDGSWNLNRGTSMLNQLDQSERTRMAREDERIATIKTLALVQQTMDNLTATMEKKIYKEMRDWTTIFQNVSKIFELQGKLNDMKKMRTTKEE